MRAQVYHGPNQHTPWVTEAAVPLAGSMTHSPVVVRALCRHKGRAEDGAAPHSSGALVHEGPQVQVQARPLLRPRGPATMPKQARVPRPPIPPRPGTAVVPAAGGRHAGTCPTWVVPGVLRATVLMGSQGDALADVAASPLLRPLLLVPVQAGAAPGRHAGLQHLRQRAAHPRQRVGC